MVPNAKPKFGGAPWWAPEAKGALGPQVNCFTMALKFEVSVLSKVVGVRLKALDLLRIGLDTRPSGLKWPVFVLELPDPIGLFNMLEEVTAVVTIVESDI